MSVIVIEDKVRIPAGFDTLEAFRTWARSDQYPERGRYAYLDGEMWVDLSTEQPFTHNRVKTKFTTTLDTLVDDIGSGEVFSDGMLLSNVAAKLSTEPDAIFVSFEAMRSGRVRLVEGMVAGFKELEGTPDMVLEVVSATSVRKDTETLRALYWQSGIPEYWLVDARGEEPVFTILRYTARGYAAARQQAGGWVRSAVFDRAFRLTQRPGPLGNPQYSVEVR
jgi:Uma2 family endonuclease